MSYETFIKELEAKNKYEKSLSSYSEQAKNSAPAKEVIWIILREIFAKVERVFTGKPPIVNKIITKETAIKKKRGGYGGKISYNIR